MQIEIQDYHRDQLEKDGISLSPRKETVLTLSGNFTQKELDKAAKKGAKQQSSRSETIAALPIDNPLPDNALRKESAAPKKPYQVTYRLNRDGSVVLRSLLGTSIKVLKRMSDAELKAIGIFRTLIGANEKFFPIDPDAIASSAKPKSTKTQSKSKAILTRPEALAIAKNFGFVGTGQNLYDWAKAALTAKSDESKIANSEKLAAIGLVAVFTPEKKPAWQAKS